MAVDLAQWSAILANAASSGSGQLASDTVRQGQVEAATGLHGVRIMGPGLQQATASRTGRASHQGQSSAVSPERVAGHMAESLADGGKALLEGDYP